MIQQSGRKQGGKYLLDKDGKHVLVSRTMDTETINANEENKRKKDAKGRMKGNVNKA